MKRDDVDTFEKLKGQLDSLYEEISTLAKKAPNDAVNSFKIKFVNAVLAQCNTFFGQKYKPFSDFDVFETDELPTNSDVTFILSQYIECAEKFRADNIEYDEFEKWCWKVDNAQFQIKTSPPRKLTNR
ncbi:hypothetical protein V1277_006795 [Bradyrhizobium sp. AZCC 1588]|uniref:hypothetical protein n=1 Tax=unclassified Bradyrhizobium TaxID=2631580 RepID=UPI002FF23697